MLELIQNHYYEIQFAAIFGGMSVFFLLEGVIPRKKSKFSQGGRWINNIALALINHFIILFYSIGLGYIIAKVAPNSPSLKHFQLSDLTEFLLLLFIVELVTYWLHRGFHKFPLLWRIHAVHHSHIEIDVTTSHRHHPFESMINGLIATPIIIFLGAPIIAIALVNLVHTAVALFSHSNIVLPNKLDKFLRIFLTTPDFHRMHHSSNRKYTDSNYCVIFPVFDYVFGTATKQPYDELPKMEIGLERMRKPKDSRVDKLLLTPFLYKKYNSRVD